GINVAPLVAGVGIIGLAIGFGSQNLVKDVINGLFILVENQYGKGDVIEIANKTGVVEDINLRRTVLRDGDGTVHFVPHGNVTTTSNRTKGFSRVNLTISLAGGDDTDGAFIDGAFKVINATGAAMAVDPNWSTGLREAPKAVSVERISDGATE